MILLAAGRDERTMVDRCALWAVARTSEAEKDVEKGRREEGKNGGKI